MLGVDFVINALFETSGFRAGGDCAPVMLTAVTVNPTASTGKLVRRMRSTVITRAKSQSAKAPTYRADREDSFALFQFPDQLLFQMAARRLFDRAPLCYYRFLLFLAFSPCSRLDGLRNVSDLRPLGADLSLLWLCVRVHERV